jgi:hypothetical protein
MQSKSGNVIFILFVNIKLMAAPVTWLQVVSDERRRLGGKRYSCALKYLQTMQGKAPHSVHGHVLREITCAFRVIEFAWLEARSRCQT